MAIPSVGQSTSWSALNAGSLVVNIVKNIHKVAFPAITLFAMVNMVGADAGPIEYAVCITGCSIFGTPAAFPVCSAFCLPILFLPGP
jgi:hypothetical protein